MEMGRDFGMERAVGNRYRQDAIGWFREPSPVDSIVRWTERRDIGWEELGSVEESPFRPDTPLVKHVFYRTLQIGSARQLLRLINDDIVGGWRAMSGTEHMDASANFIGRIGPDFWDGRDEVLEEVRANYGLPGAEGSLRPFWDRVSEERRHDFREYFIVRELDDAFREDTDRHRFWMDRRREILNVCRGTAGNTEWALIDFPGFSVVEFFETGNAAYLYPADEPMVGRIRTMRRASSPHELKEKMKFVVPGFRDNRILHHSGWQYSAVQIPRGVEGALLLTGTLDWDPTPSGIEFVGFAGEPLPTFPVPHTSDAPVQPAVRLLEELWGRNLIDRSGSLAFLPWMSIYELDEHEIGVLGLPEQDPRLKASVKTDRWIKHGDFRIWVDILLDRDAHAPLAGHPRRGLLFGLPDGPALPRKELAELILLLDNPLPTSAHERGILVADVKRIAARCRQVELDHFLQNEDYIVPDALGVGVETLGLDEIRLRPDVQDEDVDARDFRNFVDGPPRTTYSHRLPGMRRRRLVLRPGQQDAIRVLGKSGTLRGADVPAFFDNPEAFLPDEIELDLSEFAERVRGLAPVVYRSQPYIAVDRTKRRGWFDARPGVAVERGTTTPTATIAPDPRARKPKRTT